MNKTHEKEYLDKLRLKSIARVKEIAKERKDNYYKNPKLCKNCGNPLTYEQFKEGGTFCCRSCSAKWNNALRETLQNKKENRHCKCCGILLRKRRNETWQDYNRRMFCSNKCKWDYDRQEYIKKWKNGEVDGMVGEDLSERIRKYLIEKSENKCSRCGWSEVNEFTGKIPLEIHHIDGNPYNNIEENLQVLCPNCHSLTKNFKSNKGSGRYLRRLAHRRRKNNLD